MHGRRSAAFHRFRQRKGRHRQIDHRGAQRRRAGRAGPAGRRARSRHAPAHARPLSRQSRGDDRAARASTCRCRTTRPSIRPRARISTPRSTGSADGVDVVVVDTPGRDDPYARAAMVRADTLVTPINDSFVDLDLIGEVDRRDLSRSAGRASMPSWSGTAAPSAPRRSGASVDWVVLRNRLQHIEARNMRRVGDALDELSRRVGFRVIPGPGRAGHLSRAVSQGADPARPRSSSARSASAISPPARNCAR